MAAEQPTSSQPTNSRGEDSRKEDRLAFRYMFIAVMSFSLIPLAIKLAGGEQAPFLFNASWRLGVVVGCLFVLTRFSPTRLFPPEWRLNVRRVRGLLGDRRILWAVIANCEYALFAWSAQFIDITVSTILFGLWPVFFVLLERKLGRNSDEDTQDGKANNDFSMRRVVEYGALAVVGFGGLCFVIAAELEGFSKFIGAIPPEVGIGLAIAAGAMLLSALKEFGIHEGWDSGDKTLDNGQGPASVAVWVLIGSLGSAVVCAAVGLGRGEYLDPRLGLAFIAGMIIGTAADVLWRKAILTGDESSRSSVGGSILVFALLWLFVSTQVTVPRVDYLLLGTVFIITANLLVSERVELRRGFRALVFALGLSGAFVYLRDDIFNTIEITHWEWDLGGYFGSVGLSATVFTLLLAFRMARMYAREREESSLTFAISRKLDSLVRGYVISEDVRKSIRKIDESRDRESLDESQYRETLRRAYAEARGHITKARPQNDSDREMLVQVESELDALVRSKQGGQDLGEISAIVVFAWLTIYVTLATRPEEVKGWTLLMVELFSTLTSSVIIFLLEFIVGWGRDRNRSKLDYKKQKKGPYPVAFPETQPHYVDRWFFVVIAVAILATYVGLLGYKALG